jgi:hypothetical protein
VKLPRTFHRDRDKHPLIIRLTQCIKRRSLLIREHFAKLIIIDPEVKSPLKITSQLNPNIDPVQRVKDPDSSCIVSVIRGVIVNPVAE